jgi:chromosome segregation ATPase
MTMDTCKMCGSNNFFGGVYSPLQMPDDKWCKNVDKCRSYLIDNLIKENKQLKKDNEELQEHPPIYESELREQRDKIKSLEEQLELSKELVSLTEKQVEVVKKDEAKRYREQMNECMGLMKENNELKEQIEQLNKKKSIKWSREFAMPLIEKLREEIIIIKVENRELKERLQSKKDKIKELKEKFYVQID